MGGTVSARRQVAVERVVSPHAWLRSAVLGGVVVAGAADVAAGEGVATAVGVLWGGAVVQTARVKRRRRRRLGEVDRLTVVAGRVLTTDPADVRIAVHEWAGVRPRVFTVTHSPLFDSRNPVRCAEAVAEMSHRTGLRLVASWRPDVDRVTFRPARPGESPDDAPVRDEHPVVSRVRDGLVDVIRGEFDVAADGVDEHGPVRLVITYPTTVRDSNDDWRANVLDQVASKTGQRWAATWRTADSTAVLERRPPIPTRVVHEPPSGALDMARIPVATGEGGRTVSWDLIQPHLLGVGRTRSGKTSFACTLVLGAAMRGWETWLIDPKGTTFAGLAKVPGVTRTAFVKPDAMNALLVAAEAEMWRRMDLIRDGVDPEELPRLFIVMDEAATMEVMLDDWWKAVKGPRDSKAAPGSSAWRIMARTAAETRIHLVALIQQANARFMDGTEARDNFGARAAFGRLSKESAEMAFGNTAVGRTTPRVQGRGVFDVDGGEPVEAQAWLTPCPRPNGQFKTEEDRAIFEPLAAIAAAAHAGGAGAPVDRQQPRLPLDQAPTVPLPAGPSRKAAAGDAYDGDDVEIVLPGGDAIRGPLADVDLDPASGTVILSFDGRPEGVCVPADYPITVFG